MFQVNIKSNRTTSLTSGVFIINLGQISRIAPRFSSFFEQVNASWALIQIKYAQLTSFLSADFGFLIAYDDTTDIRDIPILYNVRNNRVSAVTMCTWYRLSQYPDRYSRSLFHYIIDQRLEGFQVWLRSNPNKLRISLIEESIEVDFPVRQKSWVHLCVRWDQGRYFPHVDSGHSLSTYVKFSEKLTFLAP